MARIFVRPVTQILPIPAHFVNHRDTSSDTSAIFYGQNISKRKLQILPLRNAEYRLLSVQ